MKLNCSFPHEVSLPKPSPRQHRWNNYLPFLSPLFLLCNANEGSVRIQNSQKWNCYFQNRIIMFCPPVPTLIYLERFIYFHDRSAYSPAGKYVLQSWEYNYINRSQTHECGNWNWGRAIPKKGIHKWDCPCSVVLTCRRSRCSPREDLRTPIDHHHFHHHHYEDHGRSVLARPQPQVKRRPSGSPSLLQAVGIPTLSCPFWPLPAALPLPLGSELPELELRLEPSREYSLLPEHVRIFFFTGDFLIFFLFMYNIQHCFICRPSDSTVSEDAGIELRTVATTALAVRRSDHSARSHPQTRLDLIHDSARSHSHQDRCTV